MQIQSYVFFGLIGDHNGGLKHGLGFNLSTNEANYLYKIILHRKQRIQQRCAPNLQKIMNCVELFFFFFMCLIECVVGVFQIGKKIQEGPGFVGGFKQ